MNVEYVTGQAIRRMANDGMTPCQIQDAFFRRVKTAPTIEIIRRHHREASSFLGKDWAPILDEIKKNRDRKEKTPKPTSKPDSAEKLARDAKKSMERYKNLKFAGLCCMCGKKPPRTGRVYCGECAELKSIRTTKRRGNGPGRL
jgi:hypothetical protein